MPSGKYAGKTTEQILLNDPDYARWYMNELPESLAGRDFKRLMEIFDDKPFTERCVGCGQNAIYASAHRGNPSLRFWCATCNPYSKGAYQGTLSSVKTFRDALDHIDLTANGYKAWKKNICRALAEAKGLPRRVHKHAASEFFQRE